MHFIVLSHSSGIFSAVQLNEQTKTLSSLSPLVSKSKTYTQRVSRAPVLELHCFLRSPSCWRKTWLLMCCFLPSFLQFSLFPDSKVSIESEIDLLCVQTWAIAKILSSLWNTVLIFWCCWQFLLSIYIAKYFPVKQFW